MSYIKEQLLNRLIAFFFSIFSSPLNQQSLMATTGEFNILGNSRINF